MENIRIVTPNQLEQKKIEIIEIPGGTVEEPYYIKVRKPELLKMLKENQIPNQFLGMATSIAIGEKPEIAEDQDVAEAIISLVELYCKACMVEPSYEDAYHLLNDDQRVTIFEYGLGEVQGLSTFRNVGENATNDNTSETL